MSFKILCITECTSFLWLGLFLLCPPLHAEDSGNAATVPYPTKDLARLPLNTESSGNDQTAAAELLQRLQNNGYALDKEARNALNNGKNIIDLRLSVEEHRRLFEQVQPEGDWVDGYLYFKVARGHSGSAPSSVRYFAPLPAVPSGTRFNETIEFRPEPIYSNADREAVGLRLPERFTAQVDYIARVEDDGLVSLLVELETENLVNLSAVFSVFPDELMQLASLRSVESDLRTEAHWQGRLRTHRRDPAREDFKKKIQPTLNAGDPPDTTESELKNFFKRAGIDFAQNPRNALVYDGEKIIVRLPPGEMQKARHAMARYHDVRQSTITAKLSYESAHSTRSVAASVLVHSGKLAAIHAPDLERLFPVEISGSQKSEFVFTAVHNLKNDDVADILIEPRASNFSGYDNTDFGVETSILPGRTITAASHRRQSADQRERWDLELTSIPYRRSAIQEPSILTDFIPISRRGLNALGFNGDGTRPLDPFARISSAQTPSTNVRRALEEKGVFQAADFAHPDANFAFDGEQLIVTAPPPVIQKIKEGVLHLSYTPPVSSTSILHWTDSDGKLKKFETNLLASAGKLSTMSIENLKTSEKGELTTSDGIEFTVTPRRSEGATDEFSLSEARMEVTSENHRWFVELRETDGTRSTLQNLPPNAEFTWLFEYADIYEDDATDGTP